MPTKLNGASVGKSNSGKISGSRTAGAPTSTDVRHRKPVRPVRSQIGAGGSSTTGVWRFYKEDSPGLKVGPLPVLVMSLIFIASVLMLHVWSKYTR